MERTRNIIESPYRVSTKFSQFVETTKTLMENGWGTRVDQESNLGSRSKIHSKQIRVKGE